MTLTTGVQKQFWGKAEANYDTVAAIAATDALDLVDLQLKPEQAMEATKERIGTASHQDEVTGIQKGAWTAISEIRPAAAGTAPNIGELLKAGFYTETVSGGTSVTYSFADTVPPRSLQLVRAAGNKLYEIGNGAWVEKIDVDVPSDGGIPIITMDGGYATHGNMYGGALVDGAHIATDTAIQLHSGDAKKIRKNCYVKFDTEDNGGSGYLVTAVDAATDIITISPGLAGGVDNDDAVLPNVPSQTLVGSVIGSVNSTLTIDAVSVGLISAKVSIGTGIKGIATECTTDRPNRLSLNQRAVTFEGQFFFLDENNAQLGKAWDGDTVALILTIGSASAARMKVNIPKIRLNVAPVEIPDADEATFTLSGMARQNAAAADECTVVFD